MLSIAASQILLGAAFVALLLSGEPLRLPRIKLPLAIFLAGTLIAWLASGELKTGLPQIKKLVVFAELLIVYSCLRSIPLVRKKAYIATLGGRLGHALPPAAASFNSPKKSPKRIG